MITINNLEEMKKYYDEHFNTFVFDDDVEFTINIDVESDIKACDIKAKNIDAWNINADDIYAHDINAQDINARDINADDINARDICARDINARNIKALDIKADDITAFSIKANDIGYYAFCVAYKSLKCHTIQGRRENSFHKCLDKEIEYIKEDK
jgi:hypothetical protein